MLWYTGITFDYLSKNIIFRVGFFFITSFNIVVSVKNEQEQNKCMKCKKISISLFN